MRLARALREAGMDPERLFATRDLGAGEEGGAGPGGRGGGGI